MRDWESPYGCACVAARRIGPVDIPSVYAAFPLVPHITFGVSEEDVNLKFRFSLGFVGFCGFFYGNVLQVVPKYRFLWEIGVAAVTATMVGLLKRGCSAVELRWTIEAH